MENLLIIDGNSLANRAFYALPLLTNKDGEYSNAVCGFANILIKFIVEQKPDYIAVAFDHSKHTFRTDMYAEYKGTRKPCPDELRPQFALLKQMLACMNIKTFEVDGIEADDIIGTIAKHSSCNNIVLSGDRDLLQLIDANTSVWLTKKGISEVEKVDENNMQSLFGFNANQVVDMKALMGDSADNIPGVPGIGEKRALALIQEFGSVKNLYEHIDDVKRKSKDNLINGKDMAKLSYVLATIKTDCDIDVNINDFKYDFPFGEEVKNFFEKYEFKNLLKREEIFKKEIVEQKKNKLKKIIEIKEINELKNILNTQINTFSFNFLNDYHFCINDGDEYFISSQENLFSNINFDILIKEISPILNDNKINKIIYDLKSHMHLSKEFQHISGDIFDICIAEYLLSAGLRIDDRISVGSFYAEKPKMIKELDDNDLNFIYNDIEMPLAKVLFDMEENGFKIDENMLNDLAKLYSKELDETTRKIYQEAGQEFNIKSPKQIAEILFDKLGLSDEGNKKHKTDIDVLTYLAPSHAIVPLIIRFRKIQKLYNTYIEVYQKLVKEKGNMIHTIFNQTLTSTGRLSSSEPNLQNIPVRDEEGKNLRKLFISRFPNGKIVSADYNQIELRLLANLTEDKHMVETYNNGGDIHTSTAAKIFNINVNEVTKQERHMAKAVNFGIVYGISAYGLANQIGVTVAQAKDFINKYFQEFPSVKQYMDNAVIFARTNGYSKTMYGRIRKIPEINSPIFTTRGFGERVAMNAPIQGSASDIIKLAMVKVYKEMKKHNLQSKLILQIHDELIVDTKEDEFDIVKKILKDCMENIAQLKVPLIVDVESGKTWYDAK